jgi:tRNA1(Val) A37 N6-methylase TrmN6
VTAAVAHELTRDEFLGGAIVALQPGTGHHRAGIEAVVLAGALPHDFTGIVVDLGAGAGIAGMCAVARHPGRSAVLVERDPELTAAAREALTLPANRAFASRVRVVESDIAAASVTGADAVLMNPPFYAPGQADAARAPAREAAHVLGEGGIARWFDAAARCLRPGGIVIAVGRAADLSAMLAGAGAFGAIGVLPVVPRPGMEAHRVLVRGKLRAEGDTKILTPIAFHSAEGPFRPEIDRLLRGDTTLDEIHEAWRLD